MMSAWYFQAIMICRVILVYVKKAEVKRVEHDQDRGFYRYAFEFKDIEKEEQNKLTQVIYDLPRWYLKRRK